MRTITRAAATAVAVAAATTALAAPAAATEAPAGADGCVLTYIDNRQPYLFSLDPRALVDATIQIGGIPGPVTVNPAPAANLVVGITTYIVLTEAGQLVALIECVV